jgi:hypothetical protein
VLHYTEDETNKFVEFLKNALPHYSVIYEKDPRHIHIQYNGFKID